MFLESRSLKVESTSSKNDARNIEEEQSPATTKKHPRVCFLRRCLGVWTENLCAWVLVCGRVGLGGLASSGAGGLGHDH